MKPQELTARDQGAGVARIRTIKPEFWTDDALTECSRDARLLLIGTLNFADDHGGLDRSAKQLKGQVFPHDKLDVEPLIQELQRAGCLVEYEVEGKKYLHIKNFTKHQVINRPSAPRVPVYDPSLKTHGTVPESHMSPPGALTLGREGNGREWKGRDLRPTMVERTRPTKTEPPEFSQFKLAYPKRAGSQPWGRALQAIHARLSEGHSWDEILDGVRRYADFCSATGKVGTEHVQQASRFCGPGQPPEFLQAWSLPATRAETRLAGNLEAAVEFMRRTETKQ